MKTQGQITEEITKYLKKTSNHLFVINKDTFYTVNIIEIDGKQYKVSLLINEANQSVTITEILADSSFKWYGNNSLSVVKDSLFPPYYKAKSIPYFKKMKAMVDDILSKLTLDKSKNKLILEEFVFDKVQ